MALKWNCLEPLTAIGIGIGACALAPLDMGLAAGAVIGGSGLLARIKENSRKKGLDDDKLIGRMQKRLIADLDHWDQRVERAAAERADEAMKRLLPQVMLTREQLAATATKSGESAERYPVLAAREVVEQLARHEKMFAAPTAGEPDRPERAFALQAVEAALRAAKEDAEYATLMTLDIAIELGRALAETLASVNELSAKVEAGFAAVQSELARIKERGDGRGAEMARLSEQALRGAVARFVTFSPHASASEVVAAVEQFAVDHEQLRASLRKLDVQDNRVRGLRQAADEALAQGDLDRARQLLGEAAELREDAAVAACREAAASLASLAEADLLALQWETAAANWNRAAEVLVSFDATASAALNCDAADQLSVFGQRYGSGALDASVAAYRAALEVRTRDELPVDWATTQNNLGNALKTQGERLGGQAGIELLADAVSAYRAALEVHARAELPVQWATTRNNLGNALQTQGARLGGQPGIELLGEAVSAYRAALEVRTRDELPVDWATTTNNLGIALSTQGERLGGQPGIELLGEAVSAFRAALEVYTRAELPVQWATTQNNLGIALSTQGERLGGQPGIELLGEAVSAYRAALEVRTRAELPVQWATTQNNLGAALLAQGEWMGGPEGIELLGEAVSAYRAALEVRTRDELPVQWAMTQENLGLAEEATGDLGEGAERLNHWNEAESAFLKALEVYDPEHMPYDHGTATKSLARVCAKIADATSSSK